VNIDSALINTRTTGQQEVPIVELSNGCVNNEWRNGWRLAKGGSLRSVRITAVRPATTRATDTLPSILVVRYRHDDVWETQRTSPYEGPGTTTRGARTRRVRMVAGRPSSARCRCRGAYGLSKQELYHNLYHRWPALASAHERRIGENPLFPALTSARLISDKREVGSSSLPRPIDGNRCPYCTYVRWGLRFFCVSFPLLSIAAVN
jgi:hypothetical protein